ncbi:MAG: hypothetical protein VZR73_08300, partial [Acutalibacteraceae bacterium]|nr:hypothetical protein [Acutalibacteraceae bacterium]
WLIFATSPKGEAFETFPASPSGEVPSVSEAEGFLFLCNFQICSFIVKNKGEDKWAIFILHFGLL